MPNKWYLLRQLYNFRFDNSSTVEHNIDIFTKLIQNLANCDEKLSDDQQLLVLLNSLSDKYKELRYGPEYGREGFTVDIIMSTLKNRERELKLNSKALNLVKVKC